MSQKLKNQFQLSYGKMSLLWPTLKFYFMVIIKVNFFRSSTFLLNKVNPKNQSRLFRLIAQPQVAIPSNFFANNTVQHLYLRSALKNIQKVSALMPKIEFKQGWFFSKISDFSKNFQNFRKNFSNFLKVPREVSLAIWGIAVVTLGWQI